jgi:hypothetical protein
MTRRALGDLNAAATDGARPRPPFPSPRYPGRRRDIPAIPFHWIALGAGAAKRPPPPSACVPRWPGTSPSTSFPLAALSVWARRLRWLSVTTRHGDAHRGQREGNGDQHHRLRPELSLEGKGERNFLNATCGHVYLRATNYWLPLGRVDQHTDERSATGEALSVRIHPPMNRDANRALQFPGSEIQSSETGPSPRRSSHPVHNERNPHCSGAARPPGCKRPPLQAGTDHAPSTGTLAALFFIRSAWLSSHAVRVWGLLQAAEHDGIFAWTHQPSGSLTISSHHLTALAA